MSPGPAFAVKTIAAARPGLRLDWIGVEAMSRWAVMGHEGAPPGPKANTAVRSTEVA